MQERGPSDPIHMGKPDVWAAQLGLGSAQHLSLIPRHRTGKHFLMRLLLHMQEEAQKGQES